MHFTSFIFTVGGQICCCDTQGITEHRVSTVEQFNKLTGDLFYIIWLARIIILETEKHEINTQTGYLLGKVWENIREV